MLEFSRSGLAGEGDKIEGANCILGRGLGAGLEALDEFSSGDALVGGVSIQQVKSLGKVGFHFDLAGADCRAGGSSKGGEKVVGGGAIGDLNGPRTEG